MKLLCALAALAVLAEGASVFDVVTQEWKTFKAEYGKKYTTDLEEKFRMKIFMDNRYKIAQHNARFHKGEVSFSLKLNQFSDMLHHEFLSEVTCFNQSLTYKQSLPAQGASTYIKPENVQIPDHVDWRTAGAVTRVKNQGQCGSCWAFSATGSLEGQTFRRTGNLVELSEQNLIDCSFSYGNNGCDGGIMDQAFHYIMDNGGIDTEWSYPYEAQVGACRYRPPPGATCTGYVFLPSGNEEALKIAVATIGPVSVAIDASRESFQSFHQGVYYDPACSSSELNHGVLVVGYGTDSGSDYWLVKNSWDTAWGDGGYIKMARNRGNNCGIATYATYPLV